MACEKKINRTLDGIAWKRKGEKAEAKSRHSFHNTQAHFGKEKTNNLKRWLNKKWCHFIL